MSLRRVQWLLLMCELPCYIDEEAVRMRNPMSEDDNDLLEISNRRTQAPRLSSQTAIGEHLGGIRGQIAHED